VGCGDGCWIIHCPFGSTMQQLIVVNLYIASIDVGGQGLEGLRSDGPPVSTIMYQPQNTAHQTLQVPRSVAIDPSTWTPQ